MIPPSHASLRSNRGTRVAVFGCGPQRRSDRQVLLKLVRGPVLVSLLAATMVPARAEARTPTRLIPQIFAREPAGASYQSRRIVVQHAAGMLEVRVPGSAPRELSAPGCLSSSLVSAREAFCAGPASVAFDTGILRPIAIPKLSNDPADNQYFDRLAVVGRRWLGGTVFIGAAGGGGEPLVKSVLIERTTGKITDLTGQFTTAPTVDRRHYLDPDRSRPVATLCAPVSRQETSDGYIFSTVQIAGWTLQKENGSALLQQCGHSQVQALPTNAVLGRGYAAWQRGRSVVLKSLKTRRARTFTLTTDDPGSTQLAFSSNRLVISQLKGTSLNTRWGINTIPLA